MKFLHISDLHIGKRLNEYPLIEDQRFILGEIIRIMNEKEPDCVFIAGDVYDKSVPSAEAVSMLDDFLAELGKNKAKTYIISGNHDSSERLSYARGVFENEGIYISPVFDGSVAKYEIEDEYGKVNIYLLPFLRPANVRRYFECEATSYTDAIDTVIKSLDIDKSARNVILSHQFITGALRCDSEEEAIGGLDGIDVKVFDDFDYVALGHIHRMQKIERDTVMYSGTPLKYSASEVGHVKGVIFGELKEKGEVELEKIPLCALRDYVAIEGKLDELLKCENKKDFVRVTLTDEGSVVDAYGKLKINYPYMTELSFEKVRKTEEIQDSVAMDKSPEEQFFDFYRLINSKEMTKEQRELVINLLSEIKEGKQ